MSNRRRKWSPPALPSKAHRPGTPWKPAYDPRMGSRCMATTVRDPELGNWSPDQPETVVRAECMENKAHMGWHLAEDGYSWSPDDDAQHVMLPPG